MKRIVVLVSGSGTNLQAIIDACKEGTINGKVVAVFSNIKDAYGLQRAKNHNIPAVCIEHIQYADRESFDQKLAHEIDQYEPDLVILAGFMRILSSNFVAKYLGKMLNIHPSLLPKYPGLNTHKRALENNDKEHGASIHFVTAELDGGPVVLQSKVAVESNDDEQSLQQKVAKREWLIYPLVAAWFCNDLLTFEKGKAFYENACLDSSGLLYEHL